MELRPYGIDVVIVRPAGIVTEWNKISREALIETSRGGAYEERALSAAKTLRRVDNRLFVERPAGRRQEGDEGRDRLPPADPLPGRRGRRGDPAGRQVLPDRVFDYVIERRLRR